MNFIKAPTRHEYQQRSTTEAFYTDTQKALNPHSLRTNPPFVNRLYVKPDPLTTKHKDFAPNSLYLQKPNRLIPVSSKHLSSNYLQERTTDPMNRLVPLTSKASYKHFSSQKLVLSNNVHKLPKRTMFTTQYPFKLPKECQPCTQNKPSLRPSTGLDYAYADTKKEIITCPEIAQNKKHPTMSQSSKGLTSRKPMTAIPNELRPDSRYNHKSLFAALENGRSMSPEYKVPILSMNLMESKCQYDLLPNSWK